MAEQNRAPGLFSVPPVSPTKDWSNQVFFKSVVLRWLWIMYSQTLTQPGRWFIWPSVIFVGYAAVSLQLQSYIPFCYVFGIWVMTVFLGFIWWPRVKAKSRCIDRICVGERAVVEVEVEQVGRLPGLDLFVLPHRLPMSIDADPEFGVPLPPLSKGEKTTVSFGLKCTQRGAYRLRGVRVESSFPVGLMRFSKTFNEDKSLLVYPRYSPLPRMELPVGQSYQPGGIALASIIGESVEYIGNREYREGDNLRAIDWRATARLNKPIVREYREEYFYRVGVILDTHVPKRCKQSRRDAFERAVSVTASVSDYVARQEHIVDLFAAGPNLYHFTAGRSLAYLEQVLDILACVEANPDESWEILEPAVLKNLAQITTIICVFLDWTQSRERFVNQLLQQGVGIKVIVVRDEPCSLDPASANELLGGVRIVRKVDFDSALTEL